MSKIYVVYWSQTGNTQAMDEAVGEGITQAGKEAEVLEVSAASLDDLKNVSGIGDKTLDKIRESIYVA